MPLHRIYAPLHLFTKEDKVALTKSITEVYTIKASTPLPPFYVIVCFINVDEENFFIGNESYEERAKSTAPFIRIVVQHFARHHVGDQERVVILDRVEKSYSDILKPRGFDWELNLEEPPQDLWRMNGINPPLAGEEDIKAWAVANKPLQRTS